MWECVLIPQLFKYPLAPDMNLLYRVGTEIFQKLQEIIKIKGKDYVNIFPMMLSG